MLKKECSAIAAVTEELVIAVQLFPSNSSHLPICFTALVLKSVALGPEALGWVASMLEMQKLRPHPKSF